MLKKIFNGFASFALPKSCLCCDSILEGSLEFICDECHSKLTPFTDEHPWKEENIGDGVIDDSISLYWFAEGTGIQTMLHALKYEKMKSVGTLFGKEIGEKILRVNGTKFDYIIPVPLHRAKERERTYNQSSYICKGIGNTLGSKVLDDCLKRTRFTPSQTKLDKQQRKENMDKAFKVKKSYADKLKGKNVIIADDVITTGATILECARTLKSAGCGKIVICSIAYARLENEML